MSSESDSRSSAEEDRGSNSTPASEEQDGIPSTSPSSSSMSSSSTSSAASSSPGNSSRRSRIGSRLPFTRHAKSGTTSSSRVSKSPEQSPPRPDITNMELLSASPFSALFQIRANRTECEYKRTNLKARLEEFVPRLAASNEQLEKERQEGRLDARNMELLDGDNSDDGKTTGKSDRMDNGDEYDDQIDNCNLTRKRKRDHRPHIEMNLGLGVLEEKTGEKRKGRGKKRRRKELMIDDYENDDDDDGDNVRHRPRSSVSSDDTNRSSSSSRSNSMTNDKSTQPANTDTDPLYSLPPLIPKPSKGEANKEVKAKLIEVLN